MPTGYGELLSSLQGMDEAGPVPKRHGRSVGLWPRFEGALLPMGDLSGSSSGPASRIFPMLERIQLSGLLRFVPVLGRALYPELRIRGSVFLRGMPKALTVKKFSHRLSSLSPKGQSPCRCKKRRPLCGPARACTVLVCCFSISRRHRPASRRPRQAACQRG